MLVDECLRKDYCEAYSVDRELLFTVMRREFEEYRARFQSVTRRDVAAVTSDDSCSMSSLSIVGCSAFLISLALSCIVVCTAYTWAR